MTNTIHPGAPHHLPAFITAPGETDYFYNGSLIFLIVLVIVLGSLYFRLHALPEHLAHDNSNKVQFQLVGVLALLALFTHNNIFWVAALLLAIVRIPDLATPLVAMAESLSKLAGRGRRPTEPPAGSKPPPAEEIDETVVPLASAPVAAQPRVPHSVGNGASGNRTVETTSGNPDASGVEGQSIDKGSGGRPRAV